jgi:CBS domain containing-hemolysin-like protein
MGERYTAILSNLTMEALIIFLVILTAGFFAAIESSFFSLDRIKIKKLANTGSKSAKLVEFLRNHPKELVITFLIGNELANITATSLIASFTINHFGKEYLAASALVSALLLLSLGDITPKLIGTNYPEKYALIAARPFYLFYILITPFRIVFLKFTTFFLNKLGLEIATHEHKITEEDLKFIIHQSAEHKILSEEETELIFNTFELSEISITEIMVPRRDIFAVEKGISVKELAKILEGKDYSKIPVYEDNLDNVIGVVYVKDILFLIYEGKEEKIDSFIKPILFLPEFTTVLDAMKKFNESKQNIAIVVDEHGTTVGLITYKDLIETIVGDIPEEYEPQEVTIKQISDNVWIVSGREDVTFLTDELGIVLPEDYDYDTIAGFILDYLKRFPEENEEFIVQDYKFKVIEMSSNRIEKVMIEKLETPNSNGEDND